MSPESNQLSFSPEYEAAVHDLVDKLVDELTLYQDTPLSRTVEIAEQTETSLVVICESKMLLDGSDDLPAIGLKSEVHIETWTIRLTWPSRDKCEGLSQDFEWEMVQQEDGGVTWDDPAISDDLVQEAIERLWKPEVADNLIEWFGDSSKVSLDLYPARLRPFLRSCLEKDGGTGATDA
ncbi:hypothetical protein BB934_03000 [Microvirga ossetica]|uniref:Uncharacterized protein n=1 Tax=Microvirga ossetica TaxID=1882682 RepID=A0A1B2EBK6_9HYPH|nr:hypothetical protein [Microvirga ossetica]ANY77317.1 hypothetical protein BB934_03000 [Microvirga ossetica]